MDQRAPRADGGPPPSISSGPSRSFRDIDPTSYLTPDRNFFHGIASGIDSGSTSFSIGRGILLFVYFNSQAYPVSEPDPADRSLASFSHFILLRYAPTRWRREFKREKSATDARGFQGRYSRVHPAEHDAASLASKSPCDPRRRVRVELCRRQYPQYPAGKIVN